MCIQAVQPIFFVGCVLGLDLGFEKLWSPGSLFNGRKILIVQIGPVLVLAN